MVPFLFARGSVITIFGLTFNLWGVVIVGILLVIVWSMYRANKDDKMEFEWVHLVTDVDQATGKMRASATKILQIVGGITGTFIVIKLTLQNNISFDIFGAYLAYVASIEGFSKFMVARYGAGEQRYRPRRYDWDGQDYTPLPKPVDNTDDYRS